MPINLQNLSDEELLGLHNEMSGKSKTYDTLIKHASQENGVPEPILRSLIRTESAGNPRAVSPKNAQGLTQIIPSTQKELGVTDPYDPAQSIFGGAKYLKQQYDTFGDWKLASAAYNAGPGAVKKYGGVPPYAETQKYVSKVIGGANQHQPPLKSVVAKDNVTAQSPKPRSLQDYSDQELLDLYKSRQGLVSQPQEAAPPEMSGLESVTRSVGQGLAKSFNPFVGWENPGMTADQYFRGYVSAGPGDPMNDPAYRQKMFEMQMVEKAKDKQAVEEHPYLNTAAQIGGSLLPTSPIAAVGAAGKGLGAAANQAVGITGKTVSKALPLAFEGAGAAAAFEAGNENATAESIAKAGLIGAPANLVGPVIGAGVKKGMGVVGRLGEDLAKQAKTGVTREQIQALKEHGWNPLNFISRGRRKAEERIFEGEEAARKAAFEADEAKRLVDFKTSEAKRLAAYKAEQEAARAALGELPPVDVASAGEGLKVALKESKQKLGQEYRKLADPVLEKFGEAKATPEGLIEQVNSVLRNQGLMDDSGNILLRELEKVQSPQRRQMLSNLVDLSGRLKSQTTGLPSEISIKELNRIKDDYDSIVKNFDSLVSSPEQGVYKSLYKAAKNAVDEGLLKVAPASEGQALKQARSIYAQKRPLFDDLKSVFERSPEAIVSGAKTNLPGTFLEKTLTTHPELRESLAGVVMNHLAQNASTPASLTKRINYFGRPTLKKLLGDKQFKALEEAEKRFATSKTVFEKKGFEKGVFKQRDMPTRRLSRPTEWVIKKMQGLEGNRLAKIDKGVGKEKAQAVNMRLLVPLLTQYLNLQRASQ